MLPQAKSLGKQSKHLRFIHKIKLFFSKFSYQRRLTMALDTQYRNPASTYLQMLREPIVLAASLDESAGAKEMLALLERLPVCLTRLR